MRDIHSKTLHAAMRPTIGQLAAVAALVGTVGVTSDALAQFSYPTKVASDCANFGGLSAAVNPVSCSTCHTGYSAPLSPSTGTAMGLAFQASGDTATVANGWCAGVPVVNQAPTASATYAGGVIEPAAVNFTVAVSDPDGDTVTVAASGDINGTPASNYYNDSTRTFNWSPSVAGSYSVTFTPTDSKGLAGAPTTVSFTVSPAPTPTNNPPAVSTNYMGSVKEPAAVNFTVTATDPDMDTVTVAASGDINGMPASSYYDDSTRTFNWTPSVAGTYPVTFTPTDSKGLAGAATTVNIVVDPATVSSPNDAPVLTKPTMLTYTTPVSTKVSIPVAATDANGDTVTLNYTGPTSGTIPATYDPATNEWTGTFEWTPTSATPSSVTFTFSATDVPGDPTVAAKTSASTTVTINVTQPTTTPVAGMITALNTTRASWAARTKTLNVAGTATGTKIAGKLVTITATNADGTTATTTAKVTSRKTWSKAWRLPAGPCTVTASAGDVSSATRTVDRAPAICTTTAPVIDDGADATDDHASTTTTTTSKKTRKSHR